MPVFEAATLLACSPARVFEFLVRPANLVIVMPPELNLKLIDGPERLALGSTITVQGSRFGVPQKIASTVTAFEDGVSFTDAQVSGPFAKFEHTHRVEPDANGSRMLDRIEYEAPGGIVGLYLTNARIVRELASTMSFRTERFKALLES